MPRVAAGGFAPTIGSSGSTFIADAQNAQTIIQSVLASYGIAFVRGGTYTASDTFTVSSGNTLLGDPHNRPVLQLAAGLNRDLVKNDTINTPGFTTNVTIRSFVFDQQGTLQTSGGGMIVRGIQNWVMEDVTFKKSQAFNFLCLHQSNGVSNNTGTMTVTNGSSSVVGVGTQFTSQLAVGSIIKTAGGNFGRVSVITDNAHLTLTVPWGYTTENGVTYKKIAPNSNNHFKRMRFEGTLLSEGVDGGYDASGYGFFDDSSVEDSEAFAANDGGCGFVPDHCRNFQGINLVGRDCDNAGISVETGEDSTFSRYVVYGNNNGIQFISGTSRCTGSNGLAYGNTTDGHVVSYNTTSEGVPQGNKFSYCTGLLNGGYGFRHIGGDTTEFDHITGGNNNTGGLVINQTLSRVPDGVNVHDSLFYDDRGGAKSQDRGIWVVASTNGLVTNNTALNSQHVIAGIVNDAGAGATLSGNTTT